ncbi:uncharacterized protein LOC111519374 [Drosophila willistoni]|uniref:uncharacterized protein LOC111519374 n=1 Tax=Drosophila willistoni TaxID=7260 RepID=UPI001F07C427|nr:uncharacterized protein LOC111519374 [Drosophila willistoni]
MNIHLICLITLWTNVYGYHVVDMTETEPVCVECGDLCSYVAITGNGYWCSDNETILYQMNETSTNASTTTITTTIEEEIEEDEEIVQLDNSSLSKCLPKNLALEGIQKGYCCTWSVNLGCQVIGATAVARQLETLPFYCNICRMQCGCKSTVSFPSAASQLIFCMATMITGIL